MKLSKYKEEFYELSGKASDVARYLAFAGIALIWVFKLEGKPHPKIPEQLLLPSAFLASALAFDLLHYVFATIIWGSFHSYQEKKLTNESEDPELDAPKYFNWPSDICFSLKLFFVILAYFFIIKYIWVVWFSI